MGRCTRKNPMPLSEDGMEWIHDFKTTYYGDLYNVETCPHCGFEVKAEPRPKPKRKKQ